MTVLSDRPSAPIEPDRSSAPEDPTPAPARPEATDGPSPDGHPPAPLGRVVLVWAVLALVGVVVVAAALGPLTEQRDQRRLLERHTQEIESATNEAFGLAGIEVPTEAPSPGAPVGIVDVGVLDLRRVVVEGTTPEETRQGPGHVTGTAGLGQPGNAVVVGRRAAFGGAFGSIGDLAVGDRLLVTTVQGQTVYEVAHVGSHEIVDEAPEDEVLLGDAPAEPPLEDVAADGTGEAPELDGDDAVDADEAPVLPAGPVTVAQVYGPSDDDRLTLVTSASAVPWSSDVATVVVARMDGVAFEPTPQGGRTAEGDGRRGVEGALAPLGLAVLAYAVAVAGAVWLHRRVPWRSAYLISAPLLVALTVVLAEQLVLVLPAWS